MPLEDTPEVTSDTPEPQMNYERWWALDVAHRRYWVRAWNDEEALEIFRQWQHNPENPNVQGRVELALPGGLDDPLPPPRSAKTAEFSGYTNHDTMEVGFALEGSYGYELKDAFDKFMEGNPDLEQFKEWVIQYVIGPYNREREQEAHEWNSIPEYDRLDYGWEDLKERSPQAADIVQGINDIFGEPSADVRDIDLNETQINPWNVNFEELYQGALADIAENENYRQVQQQVQDAGLIYTLAGAPFEVQRRADELMKQTLGDSPPRYWRSSDEWEYALKQAWKEYHDLAG